MVVYVYNYAEWGHVIIGPVEVEQQTMVEWSAYHLTIAVSGFTSGHSQWTAPSNTRGFASPSANDWMYCIEVLSFAS